MSPANPSRGILRWPTERSRRWVQEFLTRAANTPDIVAVVAIGSGVRPHVASADVDLLVITASAPQQIDAPIEIDVRQYHAADIENKLRAGHDLIGWAVLFGVVLLEKAAFWTKFSAEHEHQVPLPSAEIARERAATAQRHLEWLLSVEDEDAASEQLVSFLTHIARATLIDKGVFPKSRPELPEQLRDAGNQITAESLEQAIARQRPAREIYADFHSLHR